MATEGSKSNHKWKNELGKELRDNYIGYFANTTVHGLKYLTEPRRPWPERVLWFFGVLISLIACVLLMYKTSLRWVETPVIIAMDETQRFMSQIPFPAVTICPQAKINTTTKRNYTDLFIKHNQQNKLTQKEKDFLAKLQTTCSIPAIIKNVTDLNDKNATDVIEEAALGVNDVIETTTMRPFKPEPEFHRILTEEGVCFSFNMMPGNELFREGTFHAKYLQYKHNGGQWDPVKGYEGLDLETAYPRTALGLGEDTGLSVALKTKYKDLHSFCNRLGHGFQIILHSPIEFPQLRHETVFVPIDSMVEIYLTPLEVRTKQELRVDYTPKQRQCYFPDERYLQYFKFYTQRNCELECLANSTLAMCKCVDFYMPRMPGTPVCGKSDPCSRKVAAKLNTLNLPKKRKCVNCEEQLQIDNEPCDCFQSCTSIRYKTDRIHSLMDSATADYLLHKKQVPSEEATNRSQVFIFYKDSLFIPLRRIEVFGISDFLAALGGLMGLCMGISLLSVIEFFYWMLIRPCCQRIKQSNPQLRSIKKHFRTQKKEAAAQYSRYMEEEAEKNRGR